MIKGRVLNCIPKASLTGNDIVGLEYMLLLLHNYFYLRLFCKSITYFHKKRKSKISEKDTMSSFYAFCEKKSKTSANIQHQMKTSANTKYIVK